MMTANLAPQTNSLSNCGIAIVIQCKYTKSMHGSKRAKEWRGGNASFDFVKIKRVTWSGWIDYLFSGTRTILFTEKLSF